MGSIDTSFRNIAVVGAGGSNIGNHIVRTLLTAPYAGRFNVTVLARESSKSTFHPDAKVIRLSDDFLHASLVSALKGQDVLISAVQAKDLEYRLIDAAIEAGVQRFLPSEYGVNNTFKPARDLAPIFDSKGQTIEHLITKEAQISWTAVPTGLWLEWSLAPAIKFPDIDVVEHTATLWAGGNHKLSWTTIAWSAQAIAEILLHPEETKNNVVPVRALEASQNDIVAVLEELQGVKYETSAADHEKQIKDARADWEKTHARWPGLVLVKAGFLLDGYGSNFVDEGIVEVGNGYLGLKDLQLEDILREVLAQV